ncbi:MAG: type II secretion system protein [Candidatus Wallbacteria bacterium]|nr:type II secretion system protein [Candidatus Wallbacteria bacterium]
MNEWRNRGLTLVEILLAVGILAAVAAPFVWSMMSSKQGFVASVEEVTATALATRTLDTLRQVPFERIPVSREPQLVGDRSWDARNFMLPESPALPKTAAVAETFDLVGPVASGTNIERLLMIELVPLTPDQPAGGVQLKRVTVLVQWTPAFAQAEPFSRNVRLVTLLAPSN